MAFEPLRTILPQVARPTGVSRQIVIAQTLSRAQTVLATILGADIADKLKAAYIQHKTLYIATLEHPLAWHVSCHEKEIVEHVNAQSPYPLIQRIRVIT